MSHLQMRDHQAVVLDEFNGLWSRGDVEDVPLDHFSDCLNLKFVGDTSFASRDGIEKHQDVVAPLGQIRRMYNYPTSSDGNTVLVLTWDVVNGGRIWHVVNPTTTHGPILTIATMTDFAFVPIAGRAFISPFTTEVQGSLNIELGLDNEFLYVYKGDGTAARKTAGAAPTTNVTVANGAAGHTDAGLHIFGYLWETDTGYYSPPGGLRTFTTSAALSLNFSTIANPPGGYPTILRKHLVASKVIQTATYNGDVTGYQLYFIPGATVGPAVTTLNSVSFYDQELLDDASHLLDNFTEIAAGTALCVYHNRLVLVGEHDNISTVRVSAPGEPEAINQVDGLCQVTPDGNPLTNCAELRDVLYITKRNKTVSFVDNGDMPASWPMSTVDTAMGTGVHGIATVLDSGGSNVDYLIVACFKGLCLFNGTYVLPELSWKIQAYWTAQDFKNSFRNIQLVNDPLASLLYIVTTDRNILYANYARGLNPKNIKFCPWSFDVKINTLCFLNVNELLLGTDQV